jgi:cellulose synthase/poly-beta-1,6-N-acetylglucosamine synthase-like glycosyltransferase
MSVLFLVWIGWSAVAGIIWLLRLASLGPALRRRELINPRHSRGPFEPAPTVSILVAAKDEEANIHACITTLLAQDYPELAIIAVDDRSRDRTPCILNELAANSPGRLTVLRMDDLPEGWFGKSHALHRAAALSASDWLLMTDADCRFSSPASVSAAVRFAVENRVDLLTITPELEVPTVWERVLQTACSIVLLSWFLPDRVHNPRSSTAYANGAFILIRRITYDAIGGHEKIRTRLNEDIHLARNAKESGAVLRVAGSDGLYRTRMYDSLRSAWRGWSRLFRGCLESVPRLLFSAVLVFLVSVIPWPSLLGSLIAAWASGERVWFWAGASWGLVVLLLHVVMWRLYPAFSVGRGWSVFYPIGALATVIVLSNATLQLLGATTTTWRGTRYARGRAAPRRTGRKSKAGVETTGSARALS